MNKEEKEEEKEGKETETGTNRWNESEVKQCTIFDFGTSGGDQETSETNCTAMVDERSRTELFCDFSTSDILPSVHDEAWFLQLFETTPCNSADFRCDANEYEAFVSSESADSYSSPPLSSPSLSSSLSLSPPSTPLCISENSPGKNDGYASEDTSVSYELKELQESQEAEELGRTHSNDTHIFIATNTAIITTEAENVSRIKISDGQDKKRLANVDERIKKAFPSLAQDLRILGQDGVLSFNSLAKNFYTPHLNPAAAATSLSLSLNAGKESEYCHRLNQSADLRPLDLFSNVFHSDKDEEDDSMAMKVKNNSRSYLPEITAHDMLKRMHFICKTKRLLPTLNASISEKCVSEFQDVPTHMSRIACFQLHFSDCVSSYSSTCRCGASFSTDPIYFDATVGEASSKSTIHARGHNHQWHTLAIQKDLILSQSFQPVAFQVYTNGGSQSVPIQFTPSSGNFCRCSIVQLTSWSSISPTTITFMVGYESDVSQWIRNRKCFRLALDPSCRASQDTATNKIRSFESYPIPLPVFGAKYGEGMKSIRQGEIAPSIQKVLAANKHALPHEVRPGKTIDYNAGSLRGIKEAISNPCARKKPTSEFLKDQARRKKRRSSTIENESCKKRQRNGNRCGIPSPVFDFTDRLNDEFKIIVSPAFHAQKQPATLAVITLYRKEKEGEEGWIPNGKGDSAIIRFANSFTGCLFICEKTRRLFYPRRISSSQVESGFWRIEDFGEKMLFGDYTLVCCFGSENSRSYLTSAYKVRGKHFWLRPQRLIPNTHSDFGKITPTSRKHAAFTTKNDESFVIINVDDSDDGDQNNNSGTEG